jgi:anhydro-N-acetylmuramic acid kinase
MSTETQRPRDSVRKSLGLMSGTSMDGIDIAVLDTDGEDFSASGPYESRPYPPQLRAQLLAMPSESISATAIERELTDLHAERILDFCATHQLSLYSIDCVGFHGQTIKHEPHLRRSWQLGDGARLAQLLGRQVINDFRRSDLMHGGQGAPLAPAYHRALVRASKLQEPVAVLNIGGISNVTLVAGSELIACDCGPGNAMIDDWVRSKAGLPYDDGGRLAAAGRVNVSILNALLSNPYFSTPGPKSLDRNEFSLAPLAALSLEDGAATLTALTVSGIARECERLPIKPNYWIVVGGGRLNTALLEMLRADLRTNVRIAEDCGWAGDAIEAQAFAYLAVRALKGLPTSWPTTTGTSVPVTGGVLHHAPPSNRLASVPIQPS